MLVFELPKHGSETGDVKKVILRLVPSVPRFAKDRKLRFFLTEPQDLGADPLSGMKFDAKSLNGVGEDAFESLHPLDSGAFKKVQTGHADMLGLKPERAGQRFLGDRMKAGGTILIVAVPDDEEVAATYFGSAAEPEGSRLRASMQGQRRGASSPPGSGGQAGAVHCGNATLEDS